jgi:steroid delta-isomerase-like uncharacterized protein
MGATRDVVEQFYKRFEAGDMAAATEMFTDDCVTVTPAGALSNAEHEAFGNAFKSAMPDGRMEVVRVVESGDEIYVSGRLQGTHENELVTAQGTIPASGNAVDLPFADYFRVADGRIAEHEVVWDQLGLMAQLGAMPPG